MDSPIALAIMAKAQAVFGGDDVFISFPLLPVPFTKEDLTFGGGPLTPAAVEGLAQFSRIVNQIPSGPVWSLGDDRHLWDIYTDVLASAKVAQSDRSAAEEAEYQQALAVVRTTEADGTLADSAKVQAYNQYRDGWYALQEAYNNAKIAAQLSQDPEVAKQWTEVEEPARRADLQAQLEAWQSKGFKEEVETARNTVFRLGSKSPRALWREWSVQCNPDIDGLTDTGGGLVFLSGYSPSDVLSASAWQRFTLSGDEATRLISTAPAELTSHLAPGGVSLDIESLSFDYASVSVTRPWFQPDLFRARFWQFFGADTPLSDGASPPMGRCPAYVVALVFARNVEMHLKPASPINAGSLARLRELKRVSFGVFDVATAEDLSAGPPPRLWSSRVAEVNLSRLVASPMAPAAAVATPAPVFRAGVRAGVGRVAAGGAVRNVEIARLPTAAPAPTPAAPAAPKGVSVAGLLRLNQRTFTRLETAPAAAATPAPPGPPPPDTSVYVVALICKRLPKCPDPDPTLTW